MDKIKVGLIGCGNVGGSIISDIATAPYNVEIAALFVKRPDLSRAFPKVPIVRDIDLVINNPEINIILECTSSPEIEQLVRERTEGTNNKVIYTNKNFWEENGIGPYDWDEKKAAGIVASGQIIQELLAFVSFGLEESS
jgi:predicted homoserine dehydrogenase-like protein